MPQGEFNLGQMLRDANIISVEDLESAVQETRDTDESLGKVVKKQVTWDSVRQLMTTDLFSRGMSRNGQALQEVLEQAGWVSAEQLGRVLEAIDQFGEGLGDKLVEAGVLLQGQLDAARKQQADSRRPLWRVLVNSGYTDIKHISNALQIEDRILGRLIMEQGHISVAPMRDFLERAGSRRYSLARLLVEEAALDAEIVARCWSELYNIPYRDIRGVGPSSELTTKFKPEELHEYLLLPIDCQDNVLTIAMGNPSHLPRVKYMWHQSGTKIHPVIAPIDQILAKIDELRGSGRNPCNPDGAGSLLELANLNPFATPSQIVDSVLAEAQSQRGTDLHFDPCPEELLVRVRVDGVLHDLLKVSRDSGTQVVSRLKGLAHLDTAEQRQPQDGRLVSGSLDLGIATLPTRFGEKVVLRRLHELEPISEFADLGMSPAQNSAMQGFLQRPSGLILAAGPVGSGRTTTLYCAVDKLNIPERNVITLEDPILHSLPRVNQIQITGKSNVSFADALHSIARHDPDVILLGEIHDAETARAAVRAAMSGIVVMSTIRANDAAGAVDALHDLGMSPYLISNALTGVVAQRLVRRLCGSCGTPHAATPAEIAELGLPASPEAAETFQRGKGCADCVNTGYRGRIGIFEVMDATDSLRERILRGPGQRALAEEAVCGGMQTMRENALEKIRAGQTTPEEFLRSV